MRTRALARYQCPQELAAFISAVRAGSEPEVTISDGSKAVLMGVAAHRSIETGSQPVQIICCGTPKLHAESLSYHVTRVGTLGRHRPRLPAGQGNIRAALSRVTPESTAMYARGAGLSASELNLSSVYCCCVPALLGTTHLRARSDDQVSEAATTLPLIESD